MKTAHINTKMNITAIKMKSVIQQGIELVDKVHNVPESLHAIEVKSGRGRKNTGNYYWEYGLPCKITVSGFDKSPLFVFLHETAHYLDHQIFGSGWGTDNANKTDNVLNLWFETVKESNAYKNIYTNSGTTKYANYWRDIKELFANTYAQYILTKTGNTQHIPTDNTQWEASDFEDISAAIDLLFEELGLII